MDDQLRDRYKVPRRDFNNPTPPRQAMPRPASPSRPAMPMPIDLHPAAPVKPAGRPVPQPREQPLPEARPQTHPARPKKRARKLIIVILLLFLATGAAGGGFYIKNHHTPAKAESLIPLPPGISSQVNYPVYYPSPTPGGYTYQAGSAIVQSGLVFFKLANGSKLVFFTEQAKPANPVDLNALPNFEKLNVPAGRAAIGNNLGKPSGLVVANPSIINVSSSGGVTTDELKAIFNALAPVSD